MSIAKYGKKALSWTTDQIKETTSNVKQSAGEAKDSVQKGNPMSRRRFLETTAASILTYEGAKRVPDAASDAYESIPYAIDIERKNDVDEEMTPTESGEMTPTEDDWIINYDVSAFTDDLDDQGDASVAATNEFFMDAYQDAGEEINRAGVTGESLVINDIGFDMYDTEPGLGYSQEFGETLKALDNEDELEGVVEGYIEQELV